MIYCLFPIKQMSSVPIATSSDMRTVRQHFANSDLAGGDLIREKRGLGDVFPTYQIVVGVSFLRSSKRIST